jgi:hypothetical protein
MDIHVEECISHADANQGRRIDRIAPRSVARWSSIHNMHLQLAFIEAGYGLGLFPERFGPPTPDL